MLRCAVIRKKNPTFDYEMVINMLKIFLFFFFVMKYLLETSWVSVGGEWHGAEATGMIDFYQ